MSLQVLKRLLSLLVCRFNWWTILMSGVWVSRTFLRSWRKSFWRSLRHSDRKLRRSYVHTSKVSIKWMQKTDLSDFFWLRHSWCWCPRRDSLTSFPILSSSFSLEFLPELHDVFASFWSHFPRLFLDSMDPTGTSPCSGRRTWWNWKPWQAISRLLLFSRNIICVTHPTSCVIFHLSKRRLTHVVPDTWS